MRALSKLYLLNKGVFLGDVYYNYKTKSVITSKIHSNYIFDFNQSIFYLRKSLKLVSDIIKNRGTVLIYSNNKENTYNNIYTKNSRIFFINDTWVTGSLSNYKTKNKLAINRIPDLVISISTSTLENSNILHEASSLAIPSIVLISSNFQFDVLTYPIWGNDSKPAVINIYTLLFYNALLNGLFKEKKLKFFFKKKNVSVY